MIEDVTSEQHEVQRKMGRCLLRLQQYERLIKALVSDQEVSGIAHQIEEMRQRKGQALANRTLGHLLGVMTASCLSASTSPSDELPSDDPTPPPDAAWFRMRSFITMTPEAHAQTLVELRELVALRNDIVHHLIEKFDVWTLNGCRSAVAYLDESYLTIDRHFASLTSWAKSMLEGRALLASFFESKAFEDFVEERLSPNAIVDWKTAPVVGLLREAERVHHQGGWTRLIDAIGFINARDRSHYPKRYGCGSWLQLLKQSELFDIRRERDETTTACTTSFRSREVDGR